MNIAKTNIDRKAAKFPAAAFALTETILAMALGAVMLSAMYSSFASGYSTVRVTREDLRATQVLLKRMERIRLCSFDQVTNYSYNPPTFIDYYDPQTQTNADSSGTVYSGTFTSSVPAFGSLPEAYRTNMLLVTVGVAWTSGAIQQQHHARSMQTYVARDGMEGYVSDGH